MPSPIAHVTAGYVLYAISRRRVPLPEPGRVGRIPVLLLVTTGVSLLPDADSLVGLVVGDFGRFHNNLTHSLLVGVLVSLIIGAVMRGQRGSGFGFWFTVSLVAYNGHVVMDWVTLGRGVMAWWPLTTMRYQAPVALFYGLHWSDGWWSARHVQTVVTELAFVALIVLARKALAAGRTLTRG